MQHAKTLKQKQYLTSCWRLNTHFTTVYLFSRLSRLQRTSASFFPFHSKTNKQSFYAVLPFNMWPLSDLSRVPTNKAKPREHSHHHHREEVHFVDEYGQPITMQAEGKKGRGHRRRRSRCAAECSGPMERQWEALRAMMEGDGGQADGYSAG